MPTNTMKAIRLHEFGGPEVLRYEEVPIPEPEPGEVLVRVHAVGVNPPDWYVREGIRTCLPSCGRRCRLPIIPGTDVSGVVEAVGADVEGFSVGDEVFGMLRFPSFGDSAPMPSTSPRPRRISHASRLASITCMPQGRRWQGSPRGSS